MSLTGLRLSISVILRPATADLKLRKAANVSMQLTNAEMD